MRAAIVVPAGLAIGLKVFGLPEMGLFAAFGAVALLVFVDFGGTPGEEAAEKVAGPRDVPVHPLEVGHERLPVHLPGPDGLRERVVGGSPTAGQDDVFIESLHPRGEAGRVQRVGLRCISLNGGVHGRCFLVA